MSTPALHAALRDEARKPETVVLAACVLLAVPLGLTVMRAVDGDLGFTVLVAAGVLVPGDYRERWRDRDHAPATAACWGVVASLAVTVGALALHAAFTALGLGHRVSVGLALVGVLAVGVAAEPLTR